jgi:hypothetical protein
MLSIFTIKIVRMGTPSNNRIEDISQRVKFFYRGKNSEDIKLALTTWEVNLCESLLQGIDLMLNSIC